MTSVARIIGRRLREAGVEYAMGHPGGEVVELIEGLRAEGIDFVLTRHETVGAFMADAMGHYRGVPGVCVGTLAPGSTNMVTGLAQAFLDRAPVIALTGQLPADRYDIVTHQKVDLSALFRPVTKWHARVLPANVERVMNRAVRVATAPRPGPVHLEIPSDVAGLEAAQVEPGTTESLASVRSPVQEGVDAAIARLRRSRRPMILAGLDALRSDVVAPLRRFAETWRVPVMVGPKAKGLFREDHELFMGTIEMLGTGRLFDMIDDCDVVVMVGMEPVEFDRDWTASADIIHISPIANDDQYYRSDVELVGDTAAALAALVATDQTEAKWKIDEIRSLRTEFVEYVNPSCEGLSAQEVLRELRAALPEDALVTCDVGQNKSVTGQCWPAFLPRTFFMSNGLSSMGYGLPAAIGLKIVEPTRQVACVLGDGGFGMVLGDLETAVRRKTAMTIVILDDRALSQIKMNQERRGFDPTGTEFGSIDYAGLAEAFGAVGRRVTTAAECRDAFAWAQTTGLPTVIAAHIDPACYVL